MSGGKFDYLDRQLLEEIFGWDEENTKKDPLEDKEISEIVWDILNLIHEFDWYASGDTREEKYLKAKNEFKKKWLKTPPEVRTKNIIDKTIEEARQELYRTYLK